MDLNGFFDYHPVFSLDEMESFLASQGSNNRQTQKKLLAYHTKQGRILSVRRGLYAVVRGGKDGEAGSADPFLLAGKMTSDAVLAHHTAMEFFGKAYSVFWKLYYLTERKSQPVTFGSHEFRCVLHPRALVEKGMAGYGVIKSERQGIELRVTSLERTLVDMLDRPDLCGSWEEIWRSLESVEFYDLDKVVEYALLLNNSTTIAKVGFFLDQHREKVFVQDHHLKSLQEHRPSKPHYLERANRKGGRLVHDWNLVVPVQVIERSWEEP